MSKEAMKLALEALESCGAGHISDGGNQWHDEKLVDKAITALRKALAAPVQGWKMVPVEPTREIEDAIAKARTLKASEIWGDAIAAAPQPAQEPVFSFQMQLRPGWGGQYPRAVAIGEPDIESLFGKVGDVVTFYASPQPAQQWNPNDHYKDGWRDGMFAAQQEQAVVAYFENTTGRIAPPDDTHRRKFPMCYRPLVFGDTSPQPAQRPWVGLTWQDWNGVAYTSDFRRGAEWADAQLREKNTWAKKQ
jgi:hypothetical protein